jgi:Tol biopolymer transport system component
MTPVLSPDGEQIAFAALGDLWLMPIDGTPTRLTHDRFVDIDPAWSPDGTQLAFSSDRAGTVLEPYSSRYREGTSQLLLFSIDGDADQSVVPVAHRSVGTRQNDGPV